MGAGNSQWELTPDRVVLARLVGGTNEAVAGVMAVDQAAKALLGVVSTQTAGAVTLLCG